MWKFISYSKKGDTTNVVLYHEPSSTRYSAVFFSDISDASFLIEAFLHSIPKCNFMTNKIYVIYKRITLEGILRKLYRFIVCDIYFGKRVYYLDRIHLLNDHNVCEIIRTELIQEMKPFPILLEKAKRLQFHLHTMEDVKDEFYVCTYCTTTT